MKGRHLLHKCGLKVAVIGAIIEVSALVLSLYNIGNEKIQLAFFVIGCILYGIGLVSMIISTDKNLFKN